MLLALQGKGDAVTLAEQALTISPDNPDVLDTLAHLEWGVGGGKLAQLLKGSTAKDMGLYKGARNFGKFAALHLSDIEGLIGQLLDGGYVKQVGGGRPTLNLTPKGQNALEARSAIRVSLRPVRPAAAQRAQARAAAGATVFLSGDMLARGLTPEQIAAERGLTLGTIYSHLAQLIADGKVDVQAVVPAALLGQIRAAIEAVGSAQFLAPIKALLPPEVEYSEIRCVVEAWRREQGPSANPASTAASADPILPAGPFDIPFEPLRLWRRARAGALGQPDYVVFGDETLRRLAQKRPATQAELRSFAGLDADTIETCGAEIISAVTAENSTAVIDAIMECARLLPGELPRSGVA